MNLLSPGTSPTTVKAGKSPNEVATDNKQAVQRAFFSLRIVFVDYTMCKPITNSDFTYNQFTYSIVQAVPVVRIFGSTPRGQKTCLHLHKVFFP